MDRSTDILSDVSLTVTLQNLCDPIFWWQDAIIINYEFSKHCVFTKRQMAAQNFQVVVAIDIGSAFSGYVYKFRTDNKKEYTKKIICPIWENNSHIASGKTASSLLLNPDGTFNSFG